MPTSCQRAVSQLPEGEDDITIDSPVANPSLQIKRYNHTIMMLRTFLLLHRGGGDAGARQLTRPAVGSTDVA